MGKLTLESVYYLITQLCENLLKEYTNSNLISATYVRKLKSETFEIILRKSEKHSNETIEDFDSFRELNIRHFSAKMCANANDLENLEEFGKHFDICAESLLNEHVRNMLQFLLFLESNTMQEELSYIKQPFIRLLVPAPFTIHTNYKNNHHYPELIENYLFISPRFFKGICTIDDAQNPYTQRIIFHRKLRTKLLEINKRLASNAIIASKKAFTKLDSTKWGYSLQFNILAFPFKNPCNSGLQNKEATTQELSKYTSYTTFGNLEKKICFLWNWENVDCIGIPMQKPNISDTKVVLDLQDIYNKSIGRNSVVKIVANDRFFRDLKLLTVGIQSDSFVHNEHICFKMVEQMTVHDILPGTIKSYITDFIECGTCYKRLQIMIIKRNYKLMFEGFIFKALCSAVGEYLVTFREFVFSVKNECLVEFYKRMNKMMKQISNLSIILAIHPNVDTNLKPPLGSQFLGYIYKEIIRVSEKDSIMLLVFILRRCCHVFFKYIQKWIFCGVLDDPSNELFICFVDHYRQNTKYFYDKAYFVRRDSVPGFFQGYENQILQCGKYTMLLRSFKPNHPLFNLDYPLMSVYFSFEGIQKLEESCINYSERAREICGKPVTIRDVFQKQWKNKKKFREMASEKSRANVERWNMEQDSIAVTYAEQKKKRHEELTLQLLDIKNQKKIEHRAYIELELKHLKEAKNTDYQRLLCDNTNLEKRIQYYRELSEMLDEQLNNKPLRQEQQAPIKLNTNKSPDTPIITTDTEFESCFGDDDVESLYAECISSEFVENFENTEAELSKIVKSMPACNYNQQCRLTSALQKSDSDYINSNKTQAAIISDTERNRSKILSGSNVEDCLNETTTLDLVALSHKKLLSYSQRNKMKVFNEFKLETYTNISDVNSNLIEYIPVEPSELQKNRKKMMESDTFAEFNKHPLANRQHLDLDLKTEMSRNRRNVLASEFDILRSLPIQTQLTPMSTTSDYIPTIIGKNHVRVTSEQRENDDRNNANVASLKVELSSKPENGIRNRPLTNIATKLARCNFYVEQETHPAHDTASENELIKCKELPQMLASYERCEEFVKSNFKCQPVSPHFHFNYDIQSVPTNKSVKELIHKQSCLDSLSIITLTEFLQKSIVLPMNAHLNIMNNEVMRVYLNDLNILSHFKSLRNYFFLMDGEFGSIICDGIIGRLESGATPAKLLNYQVLHLILDTALGSSIMGNEQHAVNLSFIVCDIPEKFDLNSPEVLSSLTLSYHVDWPLNLILNPETLDQYANIFRYLIKVRRISWILEESYQMLKEIVKKNGKRMLQSPQYIHVQQIRHKCYHFVHALKNHITSNALQASWKTFKDDLLTAATIEDIYRKHTNYVKRILFLCMLNRRSEKFYNTIENIFKISLRFCSNLKSRDWKLRSGDQHYTHSRYEKLVSDEVAFEKLIKYTIYIGKRIVRHGYQEEIGEFIQLINYNQYYIIDE